MSYRVGSSYFFELLLELPFEPPFEAPFFAPPFFAPPLELLFFAAPFGAPDDFFADDLPEDFEEDLPAAFFVAIGCCCSFFV